jgi:prepilin-type N-terminal cleavage/methylation domain-containing protein
MRERTLFVSKRAFTLIELVVVVIVLGILLAIAIPSFFGASKSAQDIGAKSYLTTALIDAHSDAALNNSGTYSGLSAGSLIGYLASAEPELAFGTDPSPSNDKQVGVAIAGDGTLTLVSDSKSGNVCTLTDNIGTGVGSPARCLSADTSTTYSPSTVLLNSAAGFAVLASTPNITDVPTSVISGDVGLSANTGAGIGLNCGEMVTGTIYAIDDNGPMGGCSADNPDLLTTAQDNLTTAYNDAFGRTPDTVLVGSSDPLDNQLGGQILSPGVYQFGHATTANLTGNLTLKGNADAVWIFQASADFVTATSSTITLTGGAQSCHVFWQVGSSATLGTASSFVGTVLALNSISVSTGATVDGRVLAQRGAVSLDTNTITTPTCS